ncbi:hypothetical protein DFP86_10238 [Paludibacterium purpuratum]|uniref:Uncharacterized protein n=1 Tax=Paludibacterium purpuratum TaxID=1144873 RepID=A0A4R7BAL9_9NEIS|nr:hypothetical protein DFP86_10238 [Paludibacterium purpuratum]
MSSYDIALVLDADTLNQAMSKLYANSQAKQKLFQGTEPIGQDGIKSVDWAIVGAPQFVLSPPTAAQWNDPNTFTPGGKKPANPTDQMFQVQIAQLTTTIHMDQGTDVSPTFAMTVFAQVAVVKDQIQLSNVAVLPSTSTPAGTIYLELVGGIVYGKVQTLLNGYHIPASIAVEGQNFTPPVMTVGNGYLVVASNLVASGTPDIAGVQWPAVPLGVLAGRRLLAAVLNQYAGAIVQKLDSASVNKSDSNWTGSYSLDGGITNASVALSSTLPNVNITATFGATATVDVSWWLVPAACALETASNLL